MQGPQGSPVIKGACCLLGLVPRMRQQAPTLPSALDLTQVPHRLSIQGSDPWGQAGMREGAWRVQACYSGTGLGQGGKDSGFSSSRLGRGCWRGGFIILRVPKKDVDEGR